MKMASISLRMFLTVIFIAEANEVTIKLWHNLQYMPNVRLDSEYSIYHIIILLNWSLIFLSVIMQTGW